MPTDILKRRIGIYPNSWEQRERWEKAAKNAGMPLSKFLSSLIDEALEQSAINERKRVASLTKNMVSQAEEMKELKRELTRTKKLLLLQEEELEEYRNKAFLEKSYTGIRIFNKELIDTLRMAGKALTNEELLQKLNVTPNESDKIKSISSQLEALQGYDLITYSTKGWRWAE